VYIPHQVVRDARRNWDAGKWVFASYMVVLSGSQLYPWLLAISGGTAAAATFAVCWIPVAGLQTLINGIVNYSGPMMVRAYALGPERLHRFVIWMSMAAAGILIPLNLGILFGGEPVITFLYGAKYEGTGAIVLLVAWSISATALSTGPVCALWTVGREDVNTKVNVLGLVITLTLGVPLTNRYGPIGAAFSLLLANSLVSVIKCVGYLKVISRLCCNAA